MAPDEELRHLDRVERRWWRRGRQHLARLLIVIVFVLAVWTVVLAAELPDHHRAREWRLAWTGFDIVLALSLATAAWAAVRGRQLLIFASLVSASLLICDAWFDVTLSWGTSEMSGSLLSAAFIELPLAAFLLGVAFRMLRITAAELWRRAGYDGPVPPLRRLPMFGVPADAPPIWAVRPDLWPASVTAPRASADDRPRVDDQPRVG